MWHSVIDIYSIHISRLYGSLHNKELIQGLIAQTFTIERKDISKWYSPHNNMQETQRLHLEHKLLFTNGKIASCDTISYLNGFQSRLYTRTFEGSKVHIKEYMLKGYMNPQPALLVIHIFGLPANGDAVYFLKAVIVIQFIDDTC